MREKNQSWTIQFIMPLMNKRGFHTQMPLGISAASRAVWPNLYIGHMLIKVNVILLCLIENYTSKTYGKWRYKSTHC